ncbi:MAG: GNAT family N-acetyltransferase [Pseudomonadota bacterium]
MSDSDITIEMVTDLAQAPGWIDMKREFLTLAAARHLNATGQVLDLEEQLHHTVAKIDTFLGEDGRFFVARSEAGKLVGMVLLHRLASGKGEVKRMFIRPEARRLGLARKLMDKLETEARAMGLSALYLDTSSGLGEAIAFYKSLGFHDAPFDPSSVQDPEIAKHLVIMEKPLKFDAA